MQDLQFQKLSKEKIGELKEFFASSPISFCDISVGARYIWREEFSIDYAILNGTLIMKETTSDYTDAFYFPMGADVSGGLTAIEQYCQKNGIQMLFCCLDNHHAGYFTDRYPFCKIYNDRNWSDYIYPAQQFITYSGKKLSGQRNHVNKFKKLYPDYTFSEVTPELFGKIEEFLTEFERGEDFSMWTKLEEQSKVLDYILNYQALGQVGGVLLHNGRVIALSFGEVLGDTLIVHVEKGLKSYQGVYPTLAQEFAIRFAGGVRYINREEDCGDMGLRISKLQYKPLEIKEKNFALVQTAFDRIVPPVLLATERLTVTDISDGDKGSLFRLYTEPSVTEYYGYDFREDFKEEGEPSPEYFMGFMRALKAKKEEYSLAIRLGELMIGELVIYSFDYFGGVEIGFRVLPEYQKKGYAFEGVSRLIEYLFGRGVKRIVCRAYKQNQPSINLIKKLGFIKYKEDDKFYYAGCPRLQV